MKWLVLALLGACSGLHDPWPGFPGGSAGPTPVPDDPRLGTLLHTGGGLPGGIMFDAAFAGARLNVVVGELHENNMPVTAVYAPGMTVPDLPISSYQVKLATPTSVAVAVLGENGVWTWDGGPAWSSIPAPPVTSFGNARWLVRATGGLVVGPDDLGAVWFFDGTGWTQLALDVPATAFGPWDGAGLRLLYSRNNVLCTALFALPAVTPGPETCATDLVQPAWDALGGTTSDFTELADSGQLVHFDVASTVGAWTVGDFAPSQARLAAYPGTTGVLETGGSIDMTPSYVAITGGVLGGSLGDVLAPPVPRSLACTCDRSTDLSCPCEPGMIDTKIAISPDRTQAAFVTRRSVDSIDKIYVRVETLPLTAVPFTEPYP